MISYITQILERGDRVRYYPLMLNRMDPVAQFLFGEIPQHINEVCNILVNALSSDPEEVCAERFEWLCGYYMVSATKTTIVSELPGYKGTCTVDTKDLLDVILRWDADIKRLAG